MVILRNYQKEANKRTFDYVRRGGKAGLVAIPTGAGKTFIISNFIKTVRENWNKKIIVLSHTKEILKQDHKAISSFLDEPIGLFSAGLGVKDRREVTVAGIQSVYKKAHLFEDYDIVIVDECHLINPKEQGMYRTFLNAVQPRLLLGLTATPYRLGTGLIYGNKGELFDTCIYDLTSAENFNKLVKDDYLCKLVAKATTTELDPSECRTTAGDYNEKDLSKAFDKSTITYRICKEIVEKCKERKKWLIFGIDILHAEHIAETLIRMDIRSGIIHSKMSNEARDTVLHRFETDKIRCIVNVNILTTGFDSPNIDLIAMLRPTKSPVLHVQSIGRGLRPHPDKENCLVLDFAGNVSRLGPINDVHIHKKKKGVSRDDPIMKSCPNCDTLCFPAVRICEECGHEFKFKSNLQIKAGTHEIIKETAERWHNVDKVEYNISRKKSRPDILKITYRSGLRIFNEFICLEHNGFAGNIARNKLSFRGMKDIPHTVLELNERTSELKTPTKILVDGKGKYPQITDFYYN